MRPNEPMTEVPAVAEWGFADIYSMDADRPAGASDLADVKSEDWRNILVLGRATKTGVYGETLALVGRARYLADELGCRVEVLLIGEELDAATELLSHYPIDHVYRVRAPNYAPIDQTAKILEAVVRKRRPELVLVFQSRTGDAITAYAARRLGVGFVIGAVQVDIDAAQRRVRATHIATNERFQAVSEFHQTPQFVSVQRGLFRAPMEDPYASVKVYDLEPAVGAVADIRVLEQAPPPQPTLQTAERVVVAGARCQTKDEVDAARQLAQRIGAVFGVSRSVRDRGLGQDDELVGWKDRQIAPRLLIAVGVRGSLDFMEAVGDDAVVCAVGVNDGDPILRRAAYAVKGEVGDALGQVLDGL